MSHESPQFEMPHVYPGEMVLFKPGPSSLRWEPMRVVNAFANNINGFTVPEHGRSGASDWRMNVVHMDDPRLSDSGFVERMIAEEDQGIFCLNPFRLRMEGALAKLDERLAALESKLSKKA